MRPSIEKLSKIVQSVRTPLSLAGIVVMALYGIYRQILSLDIFSRIDENATFELVEGIALKIFYLAIVALILGVASYITSIVLGHFGLKKSKVELVSEDLLPRRKKIENDADKGL